MNIKDRLQATEQLPLTSKLFILSGIAAYEGPDRGDAELWRIAAERARGEVSVYVTDPELKDEITRRFLTGGRARLVTLEVRTMVPDRLNATRVRPAYLATGLVAEKKAAKAA